MARPTVLDEVKKGEICALVTAGVPLTRIARYVGHDRKTIFRERKRDAEFEQRIRRAELAHEFKPLCAIRQAAETHWRAAAWLIERDDRVRAERQAGRQQATFTRDDLQQMAQAVKELINDTWLTPFESERILHQIDRLYLCATPISGKKRPAVRPAEAETMSDHAMPFLGDSEKEPAQTDEEAMVERILANLRRDDFEEADGDFDPPGGGFAPIAPQGRTKHTDVDPPQSTEGQ